MNRVNFEYFEISTAWMNIFDIVSQRKVVGRIEGISFVIHPNEQGHNRGHVHAKYQCKEVVISIPEGEIISGNIPVKKQREASKWVKQHTGYLIAKWNELTNGVKIPVI